MDTWLAKSVVAAAILAMSLIRGPHVKRSLQVKVASSREGALEKTLVACVIVSLLLVIVWIATPLFAFADYPLRPLPFAAGAVAFVAGLWLLHRSHADLGTSWSNTLELREDHRLVTTGAYRSVRHPMYSALLLYSAGQALAVPNWLVGPASLAAFSVLVTLRLDREERMMREAFGEQYAGYAARTKRLIPGVW